MPVCLIVCKCSYCFSLQLLFHSMIASIQININHCRVWLFYNAPIIGGWVVLFTPIKYIFLCESFPQRGLGWHQCTYFNQKKTTFFQQKKLLFLAKESTFFQQKKVLFLAKESTFFQQKKVLFFSKKKYFLSCARTDTKIQI